MNGKPYIPSANSPTRNQRWRKRAVIALLLYAILGFFILPAILKSQLLKRLPALTHRQAVVQSVRMNPFALSLDIRGLQLTETNGAPFAGFDQFYANFQLSSLFRWSWTFSEISLKHPTANLVRNADGSFNFANLISSNAPQPAEPKSAATIPRVLIQHLLITNAVVSVADETVAPAFRTDYGPINVELTDFTTRRDRRGPYSFVATTGEGERFSWAGDISANPPRSSGEFILTGIPPAKYAAYAGQFTTLRFVSGLLDLGATYRVNAAATPLTLEVTNAFLALRDFRVQAPDADELVLGLTNFFVTNASASLVERQLHVPLVGIRGGSVFARRNPDGQPAVLKYLVPQTNSPVQPAGTNASPPAAPWQARLDELSVAGLAFTLEDHSTPSVAQVGLDDVQLTVRDVSNQSNAPVTVALDFDWRGGGHAHVGTRGPLLPLAQQVTLAISNLALAPLQPFVEQQANLVLQSGGLNVEGSAQLDPAATNSPVQFIGNVSITNFLSSDTVAYHEFARWENLAVRGINFALKPNHLDVDEVKFTAFKTSLVVSSNGQLNVLALRKSAPATNEPATAPPAGAEEFPLKLGALVFERSSFGAADQSLDPAFSTHIEEFNGTLRDLTFPGISRATLDIHGKVSALAPFELTGELTPDPKNPFVNLTIAFTNSDLTPFSPYTEKFAGYPLNKGRLTLDLHYNIENRALKAQNIVAIDQLTFGAHNHSPYATKLPVKLGVALLKDRNGRIELDLPVGGSLDDPSFGVGKLVMKAVVNILVKVATSPFALLGAAFGGNGEELQFVDYAPGTFAIADSQTNKLDRLARALYERPALNLEIAAAYDPRADADALARQKLLERMKLARIQELAARGKPAPPLADFKFTDEEYEGVLRKAYESTFHETPEHALREAAAAALTTNAVAGSSLTPFTQPPKGSDRGAAVLLQRGAPPTRHSANPSLRDSITPIPVPRVSPPSKPRTAAELVRDELEQRLAAKTAPTDNDFRDLMRQRIEAVQKYLMDQGHVAGDRLFPLSPNPTDTSSHGQPRVIFSLN